MLCDQYDMPTFITKTLRLYLARYGTKKHYAFDVTMPTSDTMLHRGGSSMCYTLRNGYIYWLVQWYTQVRIFTIWYTITLLQWYIVVYIHTGTLLHYYNGTP